MRIAPTSAITATPLEVADPFGQGITFHTVRESSRLYSPFADSGRQLKVAMMGSKIAGLLAEMSDGTTEFLAQTASGQLAGEAALKGLADCDPEKITELAEITSEARKSMSPNGDAPPSAEGVAKLLLGWSGVVTDDGAAVPFTRARAIGMLTDGAEGDKDGAIVDGEGAPFTLLAGPWAGFTVGAALRHHLIEEIARLSTAEQVEIGKKTTRSDGGSSGTSGSITKTTKRPRKRTRSGGSGSKASVRKP